MNFDLIVTNIYLYVYIYSTYNCTYVAFIGTIALIFQYSFQPTIDFFRFNFLKNILKIN